MTDDELAKRITILTDPYAMEIELRKLVRVARAEGFKEGVMSTSEVNQGETETVESLRQAIVGCATALGMGPVWRTDAQAPEFLREAVDRLIQAARADGFKQGVEAAAKVCEETAARFEECVEEAISPKVRVSQYARMRASELCSQRIRELEVKP